MSPNEDDDPANCEASAARGKHRSQSLSHLSAVCIQWIRAVNDHGDNDFHRNLQLCFLSPSSRPFPSHHPSPYNPLNHSSPQHPPPRLDFPSQPSTPCIFSPTVLALMDFVSHEALRASFQVRGFVHNPVYAVVTCHSLQGERGMRLWGRI